MNRPKTIREKPCAAFVGARIHYRPDNGAFSWKDGRNAGRLCGSIVGGRVVICLNNRKFPASHIAMVIMTGEWPDEVVDHINGDPLDNRYANLRAVPEAENAKNLKLSAKNKCGVPGVFQDRRWGTWYALIGIGGGRKRYLGSFKTIEEAATARRVAEVEMNFHPNHGRRS